MNANQLLASSGFDSSAFGGMQGLTSSSTPLGADSLRKLFGALGVKDWATPDSYQVNEGGQQELGPYANISPEAMQALQGYQFDFQPSGNANAGTLTATGPDGKAIRIEQTDSTLGQDLMQASALWAAGFGGLGLAGAGPLAGLLGGAGGAGAGMSAGVEPAAGLGGLGGAGGSGGGMLSGLEYGAGAFAPVGANAGGGLLSGLEYGAGLTDALGQTTLANTGGMLGGTAGNALSFLAPAAAGSGNALSGLAGMLPSDMQGWAKLLAPIAQGAIGSNAASDATGQQQAATNAALAEIRRQYDTNRADFAPYRNTGASAIQDVYSQSGQVPTAAEVMAQPGYQFGLDQGQQALDRKASAMGGRVSGAALQAANQWGTDYATTKYDSAYSKTQDRLNRLINIANIGAGATSNNANLGTQSTNAMAGLISSQGDANAAGSVASGNIWSDVVGQIGGALMSPSSTQRNTGQTGNALWQLYGQ